MRNATQSLPRAFEPHKVHFSVTGRSLDDLGMIRDCGRACEQVFGYPPHELAGRHVSLLLPQLPDTGLVQEVRINSRLAHLCHCAVLTPTEQRRRLKAYWEEVTRVKELRRHLMLANAQRRADFFVDHGVWLPPSVLPDYAEFPPECVGMVCGAHGKRKGTPCQSKEIYPNGRCHYHGGPSTGPKSEEGRFALGNLRRGSGPHGGVEKC